MAIVQTVAGVWESVVAHQLGTFSRCTSNPLNTISLIINAEIQWQTKAYGQASYAPDFPLFPVAPSSSFPQVHLTGTALCDILITLSMIFYLKKSQLGFRAFNEFLSKLVNVTAETGILCTIMAILDLALFLGYRRTNYHTVPAAANSKLYANSLFAVSFSSIVLWSAKWGSGKG